MHHIQSQICIFGDSKVKFYAHLGRELVMSINNPHHFARLQKKDGQNAFLKSNASYFAFTGYLVSVDGYLLFPHISAY